MQQSKYAVPQYVHLAFLFYWITLVIWQNVSSVTNHSEADLAIKIILIVISTIYFFFQSQSVSRNLLGVVLLVFNLFITAAFLDSNITFFTSIFYLFPPLFLFWTFCLGNDFKIGQRQLLTFCNGVIVVVVYMALYAVIFCRDQFLDAFSLSSAYGNELTAFLTSNHEYGLYLVAGITCCLMALRITEGRRRLSRLFYLLAIVLLMPNLVLTYSRTSMLGMAVIVLAFIFFGRRSRLKWFLLVLIAAGVVAVLASSTLRGFLLTVVLKNNTLGGRDELYEVAVRYFSDGTWEQKAWGHGIAEAREYLAARTTHGSVHNAYLQIVLYFGVVGLSFLILFLLGQLIANLQLLRKDRFWGAMCTGIWLMCVAVMFTNTAYVFNSAIDSYFLSVFAIVMPKYIRNAINSGTFYSW